MTGTVKWFDAQKGYGFITRDDGQGDVFVHHTSIEAKGFKLLAENDRVEFEIIAGDKGPKAARCKIIGRADRGTDRGSMSRSRQESAGHRPALP